jgi:site-specific DNA-adenine methylase
MQPPPAVKSISTKGYGMKPFDEKAHNQLTEIVRKLHECRYTAKFILVDKYEAKINEFAAEIRRIAPQHKGNELIAAQHLARQYPDGFCRIVIMAAAVELIENSDAIFSETISA